MAIRTIVIGMGPRGCDWAREIKKTKQFELVAGVDVDENVLHSAVDSLRLNDLKCFTDLNQALSTIHLDAAIVATPADAHFEPCERALSRGISVLVEKPFTTTLGEAATLVRVAKQNAVPLVVAQNYRYMRAFRTARKVIEDGRLGPIGAAVCQYYRIPHEMSPALARTRHSVLWGVGVHHLDMLRYVLKKNFTGVLADSFRSSWGELPEGASMRLLLTLEDGARIFYGSTYESSGHDFFERGQEFYARFVGQHATLHILHRWLVLCEMGKLPRILRRGSRDVTEEQILLRQLQRAMLNGEEADSSGRDNLQTMAVVEACVRSAKEKRWINPQELLNEVEQ